MKIRVVLMMIDFDGVKYQVGDLIEHEDLPGHVMTVLDEEPCEGCGYQQLLTVDPEGDEDWLCSQEVRRLEVRAR